MKSVRMALAATALVTLSTGAHAVSEDNFLAKTTGDITALCSVDAADGLSTAAINFCQGFIVGAYRVIAEEQQGLGAGRTFCPPAKLPTRNEAIADFIQWTKSTPSVAALTPTDGMMKFLTEKFPCGAK